MKSRQVKVGVLFSYALILLNTLYGLLITPYVTETLGKADYGVYKTISSLAASMMVLDFGIGGTVMRYVASFRTNGEERRIGNFSAMMLIQAAVLSVVVLAVSAVFLTQLDGIYQATFDARQIISAKRMFAVLSVTTVLHLFENVMNGIITGFNHFGFGNGTKLVRLLIRSVLIVLLLRVVTNAMLVVIIDLFLTAGTLLIELFYVRAVLQVHIRLEKWEKGLFWESGKYTFWMFLTSIAARVNSNLDNVIIGAIRGPELVAIYSYGLMLFSMYENLSTSVSGVMLPTVTDALSEDKTNTKVQNMIISVGRVQFALLGAAVVGFACVGRQFIQVWLGDSFSDVYVISLILMIPSLFELCVNVCLSVLRAKNLLMFRTVTLLAATLLNAAVTVLLVAKWRYIGAAFGTAASFLIGSLIVMNIYYNKKLHFNMIKIYAGIFDRIWLCLLISGAVLFVCSRLITGGWAAFFVNVLVFCIIYFVLLRFYGFRKEEWAAGLHRRKQK